MMLPLTKYSFIKVQNTINCTKIDIFLKKETTKKAPLSSGQHL
jgi:hypothetical protein